VKRAGGRFVVICMEKRGYEHVGSASSGLMTGGVREQCIGSVL